MNKHIFQVLFSIVFIFSLVSFSQSKPITGDPSGRTPSAEREFRAAWIASVANINWPSKPGLPVHEQKEEAIELLEMLRDHNFNAVILQVRPQTDALYKSDLEPWSYYLTGEQGTAPDPYYDPLEYWIAEAHDRGIELHAWLNPYRAHHTTGGEISNASIVKQKPELAVELENGYWWLDPSKKETQDHSYNVALDIVKRYDVDGIHFDDYFYPYPSYNNDKDFPDDESWSLYLQKGGKLSRGDWRRDGVNTFIERLYTGIKKERPSVKFGISPFGIWRPYHPTSVVTGFDQYNELYADAKLWLNEGWVDYYTPQLYWQINTVPLSFPVLLNWWKKENTKNRHLWPGMSIGRVKGEKGIDETINQIMITRGMLSDAPGAVHWSIGPLVSSPGMIEAISEGPYNRQALTPSFPWLDAEPPEVPEVHFSINKGDLHISWNHSKPKDIAQWVVYYQRKSLWEYTIHGYPTKEETIPIYKINLSYLTQEKTVSNKNLAEVIDPLQSIAVTAVDKFGNESMVLEIPISNLPKEYLPTLDDVLKFYELEKTKE